MLQVKDRRKNQGGRRKTSQQFLNHRSHPNNLSNKRRKSRPLPFKNQNVLKNQCSASFVSKITNRNRAPRCTILLLFKEWTRCTTIKLVLAVFVSYTSLCSVDAENPAQRKCKTVSVVDSIITPCSTVWTFPPTSGKKWSRKGNTQRTKNNDLKLPVAFPKFLCVNNRRKRGFLNENEWLRFWQISRRKQLKGQQYCQRGIALSGQRAIDSSLTQAPLPPSLRRSLRANKTFQRQEKQSKWRR